MQHITAGLNKGQAKNKLAWPLGANRICQIQDRIYELPRHRASAYNLVVAVIILWNTFY